MLQVDDIRHDLMTGEQQPPDDIGPATLARYLAGECTPDEADAVRRWVAADPDRMDLVAGMRAAFDAAPVTPPRPDIDAMWRRVRRDMDAPARRAGGTRRAQEADERPPLRMLTARAPRTWWRVAAACAAVVVAALVWSTNVYRSSSNHPAIREVATANGQRATVVLSDGSRVILGVHSRLRTPERFGDGPRDVMLDGEAYFEVRHDAAHPFRVYAAGGVAEDLGTRFAVRAYPGDTAVRVVVAEGRVSLGPLVARGDATPVALGAGQLASLPGRGAATVRAVDASAYLAWTDGRLVFDGTPLGDALAELGRWYDVDIQLLAPGSAGRPISASFAGEPVDDVLSAVAVTAGLRYVRHGRTVTFSRAKDAHQ
ncbi:MAG TPA: FecR domain-containing protein [Gemmatimonadaceae bacterium]|nr:FecR domain-containing protein [Gemmatimonadaceae bacterium]